MRKSNAKGLRNQKELIEGKLPIESENESDEEISRLLQRKHLSLLEIFKKNYVNVLSFNSLLIEGIFKHVNEEILNIIVSQKINELQ